MKWSFFHIFFSLEAPMTLISIPLEPSLLLFYQKIASESGKSLETVLHDALFQLAGALSLEILHPDDIFPQTPL